MLDGAPEEIDVSAANAAAVGSFFLNTGRGRGLPLGAAGARADTEVEIELPVEVLAVWAVWMLELPAPIGEKEEMSETVGRSTVKLADRMVDTGYSRSLAYIVQDNSRITYLMRCGHLHLWVFGEGG